MNFVVLCLLAALPAAPPAEDADTLVICPLEFQDTLRPWLEHRRRQGYKIVVEPPASTSAGMLARMKTLRESTALKNVVLVGDAVDANSAPQNLVPTGYVAAKVNVRFGSEPEIATDHLYADPDEDGLLELNIGRIPIDSKQELDDYIRRVIAYETESNQNRWRRQISFVAGVGGFGSLLDNLIEQTVKTVVTELIPASYDVSMTYGSWRSPYCPDPRRFGETAIKQFNSGSLFWVYLGHGDRRRLDHLRLPDRQLDILDHKNVGMLACQNGSPIVICLSCYTSAIDDPSDGLAELMLKQPHGPVAVISSSRVSMPYAMSIFSLEMLNEYFDGKASTLGELIRVSKSKLVDFKPEKSKHHGLVHSMGQSFSPLPELLEDERQEHVHLMHLLGDPLLQLHRPETLSLKVPDQSQAGQVITIAGRSPFAGELNLELVYRRDRFKVRPQRRRRYEASQNAFARYQTEYEKSQDLVCKTISKQVPLGNFKVELSVPHDCLGACHVRADLQNNGRYALDFGDIEIRSMQQSHAKNSNRIESK